MPVEESAPIHVWGVTFPDGRMEVHAGVHSEITFEHLLERAAELEIELAGDSWTNPATGVTVWFEEGVELAQSELLDDGHCGPHSVGYEFEAGEGYRGHCCNCGWQGAIRESEDDAEDDAADHRMDSY